jgi:antitoxin ParD1/3/4
MNVSLTPHLESFVKQKVQSGMYTSGSEVIREALRLLEERDAMQAVKLEALRKEVQNGLESLARGEGRALDVDAIKAKGRRARQSG